MPPHIFFSAGVRDANNNDIIVIDAGSLPRRKDFSDKKELEEASKKLCSYVLRGFQFTFTDLLVCVHYSLLWALRLIPKSHARCFSQPKQTYSFPFLSQSGEQRRWIMALSLHAFSWAYSGLILGRTWDARSSSCVYVFQASVRFILTKTAHQTWKRGDLWTVHLSDLYCNIQTAK